MACDRLAPIYERTRGLDGRVSLEVSPRLGADTAGTISFISQDASGNHYSVAGTHTYAEEFSVSYSVSITDIGGRGSEME